jgi:glycosyltransferase involved in cell wall biosynthesis
LPTADHWYRRRVAALRGFRPGTLARRLRADGRSLEPAPNGATTRLTWADRGAPSYRVVIRDETADEIVVKDRVTETSYLVNWADLEPAHRHRYSIQAWSGGRWANGTPYRDIYPPLGLVRSIGLIERPLPRATVAADRLEVRGWALCEGTSVARVEIRIDDMEAGLARRCPPGPDVIARSPHPDAPLCGFVHHIPTWDIAGGADRVTVGAVVHAVDGSHFRVDDVEVRLKQPGQPFVDRDGRAAELRRRVAHIARRHARPLADPPRLLIFTHRLEYSGSDLYLLELLRSFTAGRAFSCTLIAGGDGPLRPQFEALGIPVHLTGGYGVEGVELYEGKLLELAAVAAREGFDLVLGNALHSPWGIDLAARLGVPAVLVMHESVVDFPTWSPRRQWRGTVHGYVRERIRESLGSASAVVFGAEATRRQFIAYGDPAKYVVLPYGIRNDRIAEYRKRFDREGARRRLGIPSSATVILCLGLLGARKAQGTLVQAFSALADRYPDAFLCLVGDSRDDYSAAIREYVKRASLSSRFLLSPVVEDIYPWYGVADIFALPSDNESMSVAVLEAMAFEMPVVSSDVYGMPEVIADGRTGYLCRARDLGDLIAALDRVLSDPHERRAVGRAGAERVRERHDSDRYAERMGRLLTALAGDPEVLASEVLAQ